MDLSESEYAAFSMLFTSWGGQHSYADTLNIRIYIFYVTECRMDHSTDCWIQWTNLTVNYMDRSVVRLDWFQYCIIV